MIRIECRSGVWKRALAVLSLLVCANVDSTPAQKTQTGDGKGRSELDLRSTNGILISKYMFQSGNEAFYIGDRVEIRRLADLFTRNHSIEHACGYHWLIWFRRGPTEAVPFSHNEECQQYEAHTREIKSTLKRYFDRIKSKPNCFILNLRVVASASPEEVVRALEGSLNHVFFFDGTIERLPTIRIRARSVSPMPKDRRDRESAESKNRIDTKHKLDVEVRELQKKYDIVHVKSSELRYSRGGGDEIEDRYETQIYFRCGVPLEGIEEQLQKSELVAKLSPIYYVVQLVSPENYSADLKRKLMDRHKFVLDVFPFPETE